MVSRLKHVDPYDIVPKYYQLRDLIREKIENGEWKPYQSIPSERELVRLYNVSRITVRQALEILVLQGYIFREHGRGTFVSPPKLQQNIQFLSSFTEDMGNRGFQAGQKILTFEYMSPPARVREHLEISSTEDQVLHIERLRLANMEPMGIQNSYLLLPQNQLITKEDLEQRGSLYALLEEELNIYPFEADEELQATVADDHEAELLGIHKGSPILLIDRTVWSSVRRPLEFVHMVYRGDRYRYYWHTTRATKRSL